MTKIIDLKTSVLNKLTADPVAAGAIGHLIIIEAWYSIMLVTHILDKTYQDSESQFFTRLFFIPVYSIVSGVLAGLSFKAISCAEKNKHYFNGGILCIANLCVVLTFSAWAFPAFAVGRLFATNLLQFEKWFFPLTLWAAWLVYMSTKLALLPFRNNGTDAHVDDSDAATTRPSEPSRDTEK